MQRSSGGGEKRVLSEDKCCCVFCICIVLYLYGVFLCISVFSKDYEGGGAAVKRGR